MASGDLWAGAEAAVYELCRGLREADLEVAAVIMNSGELARRLAAENIPTVVLNERTQSSFALLRQLRREVAAFRPHVVHSHRMKENVLAAAAQLFQHDGVPRLVKTIHGASEHGLAPLWSRSGIARRADRLFDRCFDARVAVSVDLARRLGANGLATIHNGIRPIEPPSRGISEPGAPRVIGFAGRLVPVKRVDIVLQVAQRLKETGGRPVEFEIAGDGPLLPQLTTMARELGVTDVVRFVGFKADIWRALARWDAVVLTSDHEGLPMICLEALTAGVPVVARAVGGLKEVVLGPKQGALVSSDDPEALADALRLVLERTELGALRVTRLPAMFTARVMCDKYIALYRELSAGTASRRWPVRA